MIECNTNQNFWILHQKPTHVWLFVFFLQFTFKIWNQGSIASMWANSTHQSAKSNRLNMCAICPISLYKRQLLNSHISFAQGRTRQNTPKKLKSENLQLYPGLLSFTHLPSPNSMIAPENGLLEDHREWFAIISLGFPSSLGSVVFRIHLDLLTTNCLRVWHKRIDVPLQGTWDRDG